MHKKKICLFSAMSPAGGGGSVTLRSMMANLTDLSISWYYTAEAAAVGYEEGYLGPSFMGGDIVKDIYQTWRMLSDRNSTKVDEIVDKLLNTGCDGYWIVAHNEGIRIALELVRRQKDRPVHLSVQDDWVGALCNRSVRYRLLAPWAKKMTKTTLQQVTSIDVTSKGMRKYYKQLSGRDSGVTHRYITAQSVLADKVSGSLDESKITVGHIGSLYIKEDFFEFLALFFDFARLENKSPEVHLWGCHLNPVEIPAQFRPHVFFHDTLPEEQVIPKLAYCTLVYAMYPMAQNLRVFASTSMQTKLASYIQAGRPIFGQGPADSSLAEFINTTHTGILWNPLQKEKGMLILAELLRLAPTLPQWQYAREEYFGEKNIEVVRNGILPLN